MGVPIPSPTPTSGPSPLPVSATARQLLAAREAQDGTTFENRGEDRVYVEALLRAISKCARQVENMRQRLDLLCVEKAERAPELSEEGDAASKNPISHGIENCASRDGREESSATTENALLAEET